MDSSNKKSKKSNSKKHLRGDLPDSTPLPSSLSLKDDIPEPTVMPSSLSKGKSKKVGDDIPEPTMLPSTSILKDDVPEPTMLPSTSILKDDVPEPSPVPSISLVNDIPIPPPLNSSYLHIDSLKMYEERAITTNSYDNNSSSFYMYGSIALLGAVMLGYIVKNKKRFLYTPIKDAIPEQSMYEI